jgi:hypothetical protein
MEAHKAAHHAMPIWKRCTAATASFRFRRCRACPGYPANIYRISTRWEGAESLSRVILLIFFARDDSAGKGEPSMSQREASQDDGPYPSQMPRSAEAANRDAEAGLTFVIPWHVSAHGWQAACRVEPDGIATDSRRSGAVS